eukprot:581472-Prymnesium_polylepis.1
MRRHAMRPRAGNLRLQRGGAAAALLPPQGGAAGAGPSRCGARGGVEHLRAPVMCAVSPRTEPGAVPYHPLLAFAFLVRLR